MQNTAVNRLISDWQHRCGNRINRRDFLKVQVKGALWVAAGAAGLWLPRPAMAGPTPTVSVVTGKPGPATRASVELLGGMSTFVKPGQKVIIKPNMTFGGGQVRATNTDADVVREVAIMCHEAGAGSIRILDHPTGTPKYCVEDIANACKEVRPGMVAAVTDDKLFTKVKLSDSWLGFNANHVIKEVLAADVLIAVPKAKQHEATRVSLSLKGMMGLVYDRWLAMHGTSLEKNIVTLATYLKADLAVVDATRVLSTNGPFGPGKIIPENKVIASSDMVAADAMTVSLCTFDGVRLKPADVDHIRLAHEAGLGRMDVENLPVKQITV